MTIRFVGAALIAAIATWLAGCSHSEVKSVERSTSTPNESSQSEKMNLTEVIPSMMVGRESFPTDAVGRWREPYVYDERYGGGSDEGCAPLVDRWERAKDSHIVASLDAGQEPRQLRYRVDLILPKNQDHATVARVIESCSTITQGDRQLQVQQHAVDDIPSWATAYTVEASDANGSASVIAGQYRGIDINVAASRNDGPPVAGDMSVLSAMFNDQVAKLEAQP